MIDYPMATPRDPHAYFATVMAVRNLFKRQALTLAQAASILLDREGEDDLRAARELLAEYGYHEYVVRPVGGSGEHPLWIRPDWLAETIEEVPFD